MHTFVKALQEVDEAIVVVDEFSDLEILLQEIIEAPNMEYSAAIVRKTTLRGTLSVKADFVNMSEDCIDFQCRADLISKKTLCCGFDNPYILIERARLKEDEMEDILEKIDLEANLPEHPNINF